MAKENKYHIHTQTHASVHILPLYSLSYLELFATRRAEEVLAVRVAQHVQTQLVWAAEGLFAVGALKDFL